jgi:hypothetical protein
MDRGLSVGGVFGTAFSVFRERARVLVPIFLVSNLLFSAITALLGQAFVAVIVVNIASTAFIAFHTAVVMAVLRDRREGRPASSAGEFSRALCRRCRPPLSLACSPPLG